MESEGQAQQREPTRQMRSEVPDERPELLRRRFPDEAPKCLAERVEGAVLRVPPSADLQPRAPLGGRSDRSDQRRLAEPGGGADLDHPARPCDRAVRLFGCEPQFAIAAEQGDPRRRPRAPAGSVHCSDSRPDPRTGERTGDDARCANRCRLSLRCEWLDGFVAELRSRTDERVVFTPERTHRCPCRDPSGEIDRVADDRDSAHRTRAGRTPERHALIDAGAERQTEVGGGSNGHRLTHRSDHSGEVVPMAPRSPRDDQHLPATLDDIDRHGRDAIAGIGGFDDLHESAGPPCEISMVR